MTPAAGIIARMERGKPRVLRGLKPAIILLVALAIVALCGSVLLNFGPKALLAAEMDDLCASLGDEAVTRTFEGVWQTKCELTQGSPHDPQEIAKSLEANNWTMVHQEDPNSTLERQILLAPARALVGDEGIYFHLVD